MNRIMKILMSLTVLFILSAQVSFCAYAENTYTAGSFELTSDQQLSSSDYSFSDGVLYINSSKTIRIKNKQNSVTNDVIDLSKAPGTISIVLEGVNISGVKRSRAAILLPEYGPYANISLAEGTENKLVGGKGHAGIEKPGFSFSLAIGDGEEINIAGDIATPLLIDGDGSLEATGGEGAAGIGGSQTNPWCDSLYIFSGTITATGGSGAAGIGGGVSGSAGSILIRNGNISAKGGEGGAGIGSGSNARPIEKKEILASFSSNIDICGGLVLAVGGKGAAGIGNGAGAVTGGGINLENSWIFAVGGAGAPALGSVENTDFSLDVRKSSWVKAMGGSGCSRTVMCSGDYYPLSIPCTSKDKVTIDGEEMTLKYYLMGDMMCTVLPKGNYEVSVGDKTSYYCFDEDAGKFVETDSPEKYVSTGSAVNSSATVAKVEAGVIVILVMILIALFVKNRMDRKLQTGEGRGTD